jgi:hypothetical protein
MRRGDHSHPLAPIGDSGGREGWSPLAAPLSHLCERAALIEPNQAKNPIFLLQIAIDPSHPPPL